MSFFFFRSLPYDGDLVFAEDFVVDSDLSGEVGMGELYCIFNQLHRRLKSLQITKEEFVLMKSMALVNAGGFSTILLPINNTAYFIVKMKR